MTFRQKIRSNAYGKPKGSIRFFLCQLQWRISAGETENVSPSVPSR